MKVKFITNIVYQLFPITDDMVEVDEETLKQIGKTKQYLNGEFVDYVNLDEFRRQREKECFYIINRGKLWYDTLNEQQTKELNEWYKKWLDVTTTLVVPEKPSWLK